MQALNVIPVKPVPKRRVVRVRSCSQQLPRCGLPLPRGSPCIESHSAQWLDLEEKAKHSTREAVVDKHSRVVAEKDGVSVDMDPAQGRGAGHLEIGHVPVLLVYLKPRTGVLEAPARQA